ncbi:MAG: hypothetical protein KGI73_01605 [Patescibacteria group bacterium]|nr:hypothetical protein [Patescibacteria group bacterium]
MATIPDIRNKINKFRALSPRTREKLFYATVVLLVGLLAFAIGRLSVIYGGEGELKVVYPGTPSAMNLQPPGIPPHQNL